MIKAKQNTSKTKTTEHDIKELTSKSKNKITLLRGEIKNKNKVIRNYSQIVSITKKEHKKLDQESKKLKQCIFNSIIIISNNNNKINLKIIGKCLKCIFLPKKKTPKKT